MADGTPMRGALVYYGNLPVKETGAELPRKGLKLKAKLDVRTADCREATVKQWVPGQRRG